jgi:predicted DNA-binding antitoxin AbrB/MazE fold protein
MSLEVEATYEKGILKLACDLPLADGQKVHLTIHSTGRAKASSGLLAWKGDQKDLDYLLGPGNHPWAAE